MDSVKPAQLAFLAIYNPSLGQSDETLHDQVVYYYPSKSSRGRKDLRATNENVEQAEREEKNERLRQIGLAQGLVELAKAFSDHDTVDSIDAEKSRILLREIEPGWWMLASVELTRLQTAVKKSKSHASDEPKVEYSSREVAPHGLLLQQFLRAHSLFLLHHGFDLSETFDRLKRQKFCDALERFWNRFARDWDVLLRGSPAVDIWNGVKIAAGGELGIGVGEEEWGSGEREVLEGFISRTEGLVDMVVSRFGDAEAPQAHSQKEKPSKLPWFGHGRPPRSVDGVIFSGVGNLTKVSVRDMSAWMEWMYKHGPLAYGIMDNPHSARRKRRRKQHHSVDETGSAVISNSTKTAERENKSERLKPTRETSSEVPVGIPPPIVRAADSSLQIATTQAANSGAEQEGYTNQMTHPSGTDTFVKYMTLGIYGSDWGIPSGRPRSQSHPVEGRHKSSTPSVAPQEEKSSAKANDSELADFGFDVEKGCFLIGLSGDLEADNVTDPEGGIETGAEEGEGSNWNQRIMLRTLYLERKRLKPDPNNTTEAILPPSPTFKDRFRVVVYVRRPFIFAFLFENHFSTLSYGALYRSLHHQLGPLQRPLLRSTAPSTATARHSASLASSHTTTTPQTTKPSSSSSSTSANPPSTSGNPILDLVFDPDTLSIHSSLPGIPDIEDMLQLGKESKTTDAGGSDSGDQWPSDASLWTRADALNVHSQILGTWEATRQRRGERERTAKTSRGWWIVWMRLPPPSPKKVKDGNVDDQPPPSSPPPQFREAFLVRKASDYLAGKANSSSSGSVSGALGSGFGLVGLGGTGGESAWGVGGAGKLAEGIGIDARRYVESLFNLNR